MKNYYLKINVSESFSIRVVGWCAAFAAIAILTLPNSACAQIDLNDPIFDFDDILFVSRPILDSLDNHGAGGHMCDQYHGFNATEGGLYILENAFSGSPNVRNVLANSVVENGRFQGRQLDYGGFLSPDLSYDGTQILFAWTERGGFTPEWNQTNTFHIFKVNIDGTGLTQLTDGDNNDFDPVWLPDGRIIFISDRRGGYGRCHPRPVPTYTLHIMNDDGSNIRTISWHETNEWHPSVDNNGMIVYTRWDYVDRGENQMHGPWITTPDGLDARAINLNFSNDEWRLPRMIAQMRAIPGSDKYMGIAMGHHAQSYGSIITVDPNIEDDDGMGPIEVLTSDAGFPESTVGTNDDGYYSTPWPLNENLFLAAHEPNYAWWDFANLHYGIYVVDRWGNKAELFKDNNYSVLDPIPVKARPKPVSVTGLYFDPMPASFEQNATISVINVYDSLIPFDENIKITDLRIVQVLPKTTPNNANPRVSYFINRNTRQVLGTVPVEDDGSAYFYLPYDIPVYFQALDENGLAYQSMRSETYVPYGNSHMTCQGCHEPRHTAPAIPHSYPTALQRPPSTIEPETVPGAKPFSYPRLVQPVLNDNCVSCHNGNGNMGLRSDVGWWDGFYESYRNLYEGGYAFGYDDRNYVPEIDRAYCTKDGEDGPEFYGYPRSIPGRVGARASELYPLLTSGHNGVSLSEEELHRISLWLDLTSQFLGVYHDVDRQTAGEIVEPILY
ncbi:MAG: PD40 domain-containing protein [Deltaproteobacteria bacterium]|nr:PD40 domain-containing protein [Deltaproteobacteria bacterium]